MGERYCISVPPCPDSRWGNGVPPTKYLGERRSPRSPAFPLHYTTGVKTGMLGDSSGTSTTGVLGADTLSNGSSVVLCNDNSALALPAERGWNPSLPGAESVMLFRSCLQKELLSIMKQLLATIMGLSDGVHFTILLSLCYSQYRRAADGRTDRHVAIAKTRASIASRG